MNLILKYCFYIVLLLSGSVSYGQPVAIDSYNQIWTTQSQNASESMPVGGGDIGANIWVENNELFLYFMKTGSFDEN
ncbi:MAG TPA: DUF5703 domain-containing protein, partial [Niabella sp.]|nr:DUF5703 domain-containing protein [Niabella sp.]